MNQSFRIPQFLLRVALGVSFLSPVGDRLGLLGNFGSPNIEWGNWDRFIGYTATLMPFLEKPVVNIMGTLATIAEIIIGLLLIIGFKTKVAAIGSSLLTFIFIIAMTTSLGVKAPINYSVFTTCFASLLLASLPTYDWSIDNLLRKNSSKGLS
jgi:uncharacterized membrane protein YphA (DoxX/SURF4 family)